MHTSRADVRNALICCGVALAALLLAWPFSALPFNDDWTWAFTVKQLQLTGHLVYNGWSSPSVIAQAYWGLLWVKVFGFSFNVLRVSSMPMSINAVGLSYLLARRAGLTAAMAIFVAMLLGFSPIYMPLEATFMSDAPGLFFMLLSLLAIVIGFDSLTVRSSVGWLVFGALAALVGGSSRQVVWIVPLVVLPYFAWLRRANISFAIVCFIGWMIVLIGAAGMQHWFAQQPYALPDPPLHSYISLAAHHVPQLVKDILLTVLTLALMLLPAVYGAIPGGPFTATGLELDPDIRVDEGRVHLDHARSLKRPKLITGLLPTAGLAAIFSIVLWQIVKHVVPSVEPWMGNIFTSSGPIGSVEIAGGRPPFQGPHIQTCVSMIVVFGLCLLLASAMLWLVQNRRDLSKKLPAFALRSQGVHPVIPAMLLLVLALFALEMTRWISEVAFDRHLLPFIPFIAIPLLLAYQQTGLKQMPMGSWALLAIFAVVAIAQTQEVNSLARARVAAVLKLNAAGIADNQIDAGFEHDYWTEVQLDGYINDPRITNPPGAYDKRKGPTPGMRIVYRLESRPTAVTRTTQFGTVDYFSLLPPFHNTIYIDKFVDPWWLDPSRAATRPADKSLLPRVLLEQYKSK